MLKTGIKSIQLDDYAEVLTELEQLKWFDTEFKKLCPTARIDTPTTNKDCNENKWWEWSRALHLIKGEGTGLRILDIGAACSLLGPMLAYLDYEVTEAEIDAAWKTEREKINRLIVKNPIKWIQSGYGTLEERCRIPIIMKPRSLGLSTDGPKFILYDAVLSISTIEHVPPNVERTAWKEMVDLVKPGGLLIITADVMPQAKKGYQNDHVRWTNYSMDIIKQRVDYMKEKLGMSPIGEEDYNYHGSFVYDYSFAMIAMRKK